VDRSEIRALEERFERLEAEMADLREGRDDAAPRSGDSAPPRVAEPGAQRSSRRDLLTKAGLAAGGAVALAGAGALPAAAQDPRGPFVPFMSILDVPLRVYDSRPGRPIGWPGPIVRGRITNTQVRNIQVFFPATPLDSVIINLTAVETSPEGFLSAYKGDIPFPGTSTLNWSTSGDIIANSTIVTVDPAGQIRVRCSGSCHFIVDLMGGFHY
jgi:hypothetical protein